MPKKRYACSSKTRKRIYEAATKLFAENGYQAVTLSDIAKAADVSTGTLYRYFPSKGDFLVYIGRDSVERLEQFAQKLPSDMPVFDAVLAVLLEDIAGTKGIFFTSIKSDAEGLQFQASDVRLAYSSEIYSSKNHLDFELRREGGWSASTRRFLRRLRNAANSTLASMSISLRRLSWLFSSKNSTRGCTTTTTLTNPNLGKAEVSPRRQSACFHRLIV